MHRYALSLCLGLLILVSRAPAAVPTDPAAVTPLDVGMHAPGFLVREVSNRPFRFDPTGLQKPVLLIFFRGGWCPYCNAHLQELRTVEPQIVALGYEVLFLSTDQPRLLYSSLKEKVSYHLLSDSGLHAAEAFGVAWHVDGAALQKLKSYGIDLEATQGNRKHELPVPSVFIVDRSGIIRFRYYNPDFQVRLDAASILEAARSAISGS